MKAFPIMAVLPGGAKDDDSSVFQKNVKTFALLSVE